jgi:hypothetical protein
MDVSDVISRKEARRVASGGRHIDSAARDERRARGCPAPPPPRPPPPPAPPGGRVLLRGSGGVADCDSLRLSKGQWSLVCRFPLRIGNQDAATGTAARRAPPLTTKLAAEPPQTPDRTERSRRPFGWPWPLRHSRSGPRGCHAFKGPGPGLSSASPHAFSSLTPRPPSRARLRSVLVSHIG